MFSIKSNIDTSSEDYKKNRDDYLGLLSEFRSRLNKIQKGGSEAAVKKHKERKKLLARERIDLLVDRNTPFLELSSFAAYGQYNNQFPSAGIVNQ